LINSAFFHNLPIKSRIKAAQSLKRLFKTPKFLFTITVKYEYIFKISIYKFPAITYLISKSIFDLMEIEANFELFMSRLYIVC